MGRSLAIILLIVVMMAIGGIGGKADGVKNKSASGGLFWSTAKEEGDLQQQQQQQVVVSKAKTDSDESSSAALQLNQADELDGGFSSLDGMLQWAIGHSDPTKLQETAQEVQRLSPDDLKKRQIEIKELMEKLKMPSDAQLMQIAIDDLNNSSLASEVRHRALQELLILVEPIDNAIDLHKLGGFAAVIGELSNPDPGIRTTAAWILGKASQNNLVVQKQVLELGALKKLMMMVKSSCIEEGIKAFYAISALIRNNLDGQELFCAEAGGLMLQDILINLSIDIRLRKKAVFLVADLAESQLETRDKVELPFFSNRVFLKSMVDLTASADDLDLQEKALHAIKNLLQLRSSEALIFKDFCGLDGALESTRQRLQQLMTEESQREYAMDVESLRREVELIFLGKLNEVIEVPT
ncbi:hypothetical protein LguiB_016372 [Lonicera macranthoides]